MNGSGSPIRCQHRSSARAKHAPNNEPTSGLVTKSRPARPAPRPDGEEADVGLVQRDVDEPVEGDSALAPDQARDGVGGRCRLERPLPDPGEQLRVDADDDHDRSISPIAPASAGGTRMGLPLALGRLVEPDRRTTPE